MKKIFIFLSLFTVMFFASCATVLEVPDVDIYAENVPVTVTATATGTDCKQISLKRVSDYGAVKAAERDGYDSIVCLGQITSQSLYESIKSISRNSMRSVYLFFKGDVKQRFKDTEKYQVLYLTDKEKYKSLAKKAYADEYNLWNWLAIELGLSILTYFIATPIIPFEIIRYNIYKPRD